MRVVSLVRADLACSPGRSLLTLGGSAVALFLATLFASLADAWQVAAGAPAAAGAWSLLRLGAFTAVGALIALGVLGAASTLRARVETTALLERLGAGEQTLARVAALGEGVLFGLGGLIGGMAARLLCQSTSLVRGFVGVPVVVGWPRVLFALAIALLCGVGAGLVAVKSLRPHLARAHERSYPEPLALRPRIVSSRPSDRLEL